MKTHQNNIFFIFLIYSSLVFGQNSYKFEVEKPIRYDFDPMLYEGITFEFEGERKFISKNIFYEMSVLRVLDTFKINNKRWFIKDNGVWKDFFYERNFVKREPIKWKDLYLFPLKKIKIKNKLLYLYNLYPDKKLLKEKDRKYTIVYFSSIEGITKIEYEKFALIRKWQKTRSLGNDTK